MLLRKMIAFSIAMLVIANVAVAQDFMYVGAAKCKTCHNTAKSGFQYKIWSESTHAKALASLGSQASLDYAKKNGIADPTKEPSCLACHSTYHMVKKDQIETLTATEGVSCESCHGPGSAYKSMTVMKNQQLALTKGLILPTKEVCVTCHNPKNPFHKPFNYDEAVKIIAHPTPEAQ